MHPVERLPSFPFGDDDSPDQRRTIALPLVDIGAQLARGSRYPLAEARGPHPMGCGAAANRPNQQSLDRTFVRI
jgi:hypothetical protein